MAENFMVEKMSAANNNIYESRYNSAAVNSDNNIDESIFNTVNQSTTKEEDVEALEAQLAAIQAKNGAILDGWNNFKEATNLGTSAEKCDKAIEQYQNGEITYEEAEQIINEFGAKQDSSLNLFSNITTSIAAIGTVAAVAATIATGGLAAPAAIAIGAGAGALTKAGFKAADRATNEVEGDALDGKELAKDALSGTVTGGLATFSMGTASTAKTLGAAVKGCTKTGLITGSISGASNYAIDCSFDEDKDFEASEFVKTTAENAVIGGAVGAIMGSYNFGLHSSGALKSGCGYKTMIQSNQPNINDVAANSVCTAEYKVVTDRIKDIAA